MNFSPKNDVTVPRTPQRNKSTRLREREILSFQHIYPQVIENQRIPKRIFDLSFSFLVLIFLAPLFVFIIFAIRLSSKGRAIYVQSRVGRGGRIFRCYKFRTMHHGADKRLNKILSMNPYMRQEWNRNQKLKNDPRVFKFGQFLRRTSLDELPQFWNVIKGDLSIVGPRPYMVSQKRELGYLAYKILSVRPGITGLWQTSGRSRTTFQERINLDAEYVGKQSFWFDLGLIFKTIPQVFLFKNAC